MKANLGKVLVLAAVAAAVATVALSYSDTVQDVLVRNWPRVFPVEGRVELKGPIPHAEMVRREGVLVTTSHRAEVAELIPAGTVECDGYTEVTVSFQGEVKATNTPERSLIQSISRSKGPAPSA